MMDANEHVMTGRLSKALEAWGLQSAVHWHKRGIGLKTHFRRKMPIDKVWVSDDIVVMGTAYLPFQ